MQLGVGTLAYVPRLWCPVQQAKTGSNLQFRLLTVGPMAFVPTLRYPGDQAKTDSNPAIQATGCWAKGPWLRFLSFGILATRRKRAAMLQFRLLIGRWAYVPGLRYPGDQAHTGSNPAVQAISSWVSVPWLGYRGPRLGYLGPRLGLETMPKRVATKHSIQPGSGNWA